MKEDIAYITIAANVAAHAYVQGSAPGAFKLLETIEQARVKWAQQVSPFYSWKTELHRD